MNILEVIQKFQKDCRENTSVLIKKELLKEYDSPEFRKILLITYSWVLGVTDTSIRNYLEDETKLEESDYNEYKDIFSLAEDLEKRKITGYKALKSIIEFIKENIEYKEVIIDILKGNLDIGISSSIINDIYTGCIPTFSVALAQKWSEKLFKGKEFLVSHKLDGVRLLTIINNGNINFFSRSWKEYTCFDKLKQTFKVNLVDKGIDNIVLDWEACIVDLIDGREVENFKETVSAIRRKDHTIENPRYYLFDYISLDDFNKKYSSISFWDRYNQLQELITDIPYVSILEQTIVKNETDLQILVDEAKKYSWEGLILRDINSPYQGKRSNDILKYKISQIKQELFQEDAEFEVLDTVNNIMTVSENKKVQREEMLANIVIEYEWKRVDVGSGFSREERRKYYLNPETIIWKQVTVAYTWLTEPDKDGKRSLRFPIYKGIRDYE